MYNNYLVFVNCYDKYKLRTVGRTYKVTTDNIYSIIGKIYTLTPDLNYIKYFQVNDFDEWFDIGSQCIEPIEYEDIEISEFNKL